MEALSALLIAGAFAFACAPVLSRHPMPFYLVFALIGAVYASGAVAQAFPALELALIPFLRRASLAFGLFSVVMFVGVLPEGSSVRMRLQPARGPLALLGAILIIVHIAGYLATYLATLMAGAANSFVLAGLFMGLVVAVLLALLSITSITAVRRKMDAANWRKLQKLAYPFYLLMYFHLAAMLVPSSMLGGNSALNLIVYTVVVVAYIVLRLARARS